MGKYKIYISSARGFEYTGSEADSLEEAQKMIKSWGGNPNQYANYVIKTPDGRSVSYHDSAFADGKIEADNGRNMDGIPYGRLVEGGKSYRGFECLSNENGLIKGWYRFYALGGNTICFGNSARDGQFTNEQFNRLIQEGKIALRDSTAVHDAVSIYKGVRVYGWKTGSDQRGTVVSDVCSDGGRLCCTVKWDNGREEAVECASLDTLINAGLQDANDIDDETRGEAEKRAEEKGFPQSSVVQADAPSHYIAPHGVESSAGKKAYANSRESGKSKEESAKISWHVEKNAKGDSMFADYEAKGSFNNIEELRSYFKNPNISADGDKVLVKISSGETLEYTKAHGKLIFIRRVKDSNVFDAEDEYLLKVKGKSQYWSKGGKWGGNKNEAIRYGRRDLRHTIQGDFEKAYGLDLEWETVPAKVADSKMFKVTDRSTGKVRLVRATDSLEAVHKVSAVKDADQSHRYAHETDVKFLRECLAETNRDIDRWESKTPKEKRELQSKQFQMECKKALIKRISELEAK